jgi:hypothetical protein
MPKENQTPIREMMKGVTIEGRGSHTVKCPKCGKEGSLVLKSTKTGDRTYKYYYVEHSIGKRKSWCYLGKFGKLPMEYREIFKTNP